MKNFLAPEVRRLREFHALGKQVLKVYETSEPLASGSRRRGVAREFDSKLGLKRDQVDKARQFAAMYSDEEVDALCELVNRSDRGQITKSHVIRLLAVRNRRERLRLAKQVVRERWSVERLGIEICKRGKVSRGGRRPKRPATVGEAMEQIQRMAQQWERWVEMMSDDGGASRVGLGELPKQIAKSVAHVSIALKTLSAAASTARTYRKS